MCVEFPCQMLHNSTIIRIHLFVSSMRSLTLMQFFQCLKNLIFFEPFLDTLLIRITGEILIFLTMNSFMKTVHTQKYCAVVVSKNKAIAIMFILKKFFHLDLKLGQQWKFENSNRPIRSASQ